MCEKWGGGGEAAEKMRLRKGATERDGGRGKGNSRRRKEKDVDSKERGTGRKGIHTDMTT